MPDSFRVTLETAVAPFLSLQPDQLRALEQHFQLLERWNRSLNLTAIRSPEEAVQLHYAESLFFASVLPTLPSWDPAVRIVDVGSGAGFPGFPTAVLHASTKVTLVESHQRKAVFLRETSRLVPNIHIVSSRFEAIDGHWELAISRAVAWGDIRKRVLARCRAIALLASEADTPGILATSGVSWFAPVPLPARSRGNVLLGVASPE